jgi:cardiolipin synthase A/B
VVSQLQEVFADYWLFTTGEALRGDSWFPKIDNAGQVLARGVTDGPDENFEKLLWTLLGALSLARHSVRIITPYFLPDPAVVSALNLAGMRAVQVDIILPSRINLHFVLWASRAMWLQVFQHGCRKWLTPPPSITQNSCWLMAAGCCWDRPTGTPEACVSTSS